MFRAEAKGKTLHFDYDSMAGANEVFKDRETGSRWQQASAAAVSGPLKGAHLALYPFIRTTWGEWKKQHPQTLVLKPLPGYAELMPMMNQIISRSRLGEGPAPRGAPKTDDRLPPREMVAGLEVGKEAKAYPLPELRKIPVVNDRVGGSPVLIVHQPNSDTTTAFEARVKKRTLHFEAMDADAGRLLDLETRSTWNAYGLCLSGRLHGAQLKALILVPEFWFAWSEFHPQTNLYRYGGAH